MGTNKGDLVLDFFRGYVQHFETLVDLLLPSSLPIGPRDIDTLPTRNFFNVSYVLG